MKKKLKKYQGIINGQKVSIEVKHKLMPPTSKTLKKESRQLMTVKLLVMLAALLALGVVLKFVSIGNGQFRISLWDIPLFLAGVLAGPVYGGIVAMGADLIYGLCFSSYPFSFIMMFTTIVWGVMGGIFYHRGIKIWSLLVVVLITSLIATFINSIYLTLYYGFNYMLGMLPIRLGVLFVKWPITSFLVYFLNKMLKNLKN